MKKNYLWLGVSVLMLTTLVLPSCTPKAVTPTAIAPTAIAPTAIAPTAVPMPEGEVVVRLATALEEGFLPWVGGSQHDLWEIVYDYLIYTKTDYTFVGGLAERWETSADATAVTVWLRKGIQFNDGWGELTAEDVKYTFEKIMGPDSTAQSAEAFNETIESIEIVDPYTIVIHLKESDPVWWLSLTDSAGIWQPIVSKKYIETVGESEAMEHPIGSGPYRLVEHVFGDYLKFEAVEDHWRVVPEFQYLTLKIIPEISTAIAQLKTGVIDATVINSAQIPEVEQAGFRIRSVPGAGTLFLVFGGMQDPQDSRYVEGYSRQDPWADVRVREAMNLAIDRQAIIDALYAGIAVPCSMSWNFTGRDDLEPIAYDPEKARQLLTEAGYPDGFSFEVASYPRDIEVPLMIEAVVGYWEEIGLKPSIVMTDFAAYRAEHINIAKTAGKLHSIFASWKLDPTSSTRSHLTINGTNGTFQSEESQALIDKILPEVDWNKRTELYSELGTYLRDNYASICIADIRETWAISDKIEDLPPRISSQPQNLAYLRHAEPLNTFRLFDLGE